MRESCTYGSVRGALSNERPYRDSAGGNRPHELQLGLLGRMLRSRGICCMPPRSSCCARLQACSALAELAACRDHKSRVAASSSVPWGRPTHQPTNTRSWVLAAKTTVGARQHRALAASL